MEADSTTTMDDAKTDSTDLPEDGAQNIAEESAMSHDSEYDDFLGVPDSLDITMNENGEPVSIEEVNEDTCSKGEQYISLFVQGYMILCISFISNNRLSDQRKALPFSTIHNDPVKFKSSSRNIFIPGEDVYAKIIDIERSVTTHPLNPNLYTIEFTHGPFTWTIKKRYKHIQNLHNQLKIYRASLNIPFPTKSHREKRNSFKNMAHAKEKKRRRGALPR